jgi:hypothetical protein
MDGAIVTIAGSFEQLARQARDAKQLFEQIALKYPDADLAVLRRAAIYAVTSPTIDPEAVTKIHAVAMQLRARLPLR